MRQFARTIDYDVVRRNRLPWYRRGPTLIYRTGNTVHRLGYGLRMTMQNRILSVGKPTRPRRKFRQKKTVD